MLLHRSWQIIRVNSPGGSTFIHEMTSWLPPWMCDVKLKIQFRQSVCIYFMNNHPDTIWSDGAIGFHAEVAKQEKEEQQQDELWYEISSWSNNNHNNNNNNNNNNTDCVWSLCQQLYCYCHHHVYQLHVLTFMTCQLEHTVFISP